MKNDYLVPIMAGVAALVVIGILISNRSVPQASGTRPSLPVGRTLPNRDFSNCGCGCG